MDSFELPFRKNFSHRSQFTCTLMYINVGAQQKHFPPIIHSLKASSSSREAKIKRGERRCDWLCIEMNLSVVRCSSLNF